MRGRTTSGLVSKEGKNFSGVATSIPVTWQPKEVELIKKDSSKVERNPEGVEASK